MRGTRGTRVWLPLAALLLVLLAAPWARGESLCVAQGMRSARTGTIRTAPEGERYGAAEDCEWTIAPQPTAAGECVELHVVEMDVDEDWDFLIVTGEHTNKVLSGWYEDLILPATSPSLHLRFLSDIDPWADLGVVAEWRVVPCIPPDAVKEPECVNTGVITARSGTLRALNASLPEDEPLPPGLDCTWTLQPPLGEGECVVATVVRGLRDSNMVWATDFATLELRAGDASAVMDEPRFRSAASTDALTVHLVSLAKGSFFDVDVIGFIIDYSVEPCADVQHLLPLRAGEENVVTLRAESGVVPKEAKWRKGTVFIINSTRLQEDDMCVNVETQPNTLQGYDTFIHGVPTAWPMLSVATRFQGLGAMRVHTLPFVNHAVYGTYEVAPCPGRSAELRGVIDMCSQLKALFRDFPGFATLLDSMVCCDVHVHNSHVTLGIDCELMVPVGLTATALPPSLTQAVVDLVGYLPSVTSVFVRNAVELSYTPTSAALQRVSVLSIGTLHLDMSRTNVTALRISECTVDTLVVPPTVREVTLQDNQYPDDMVMPWESLPLVDARIIDVHLGDMAWPHTLKTLFLSRVQVTALPVHEGLEYLTCRDCGTVQLTRLPSTLRKLSLPRTTVPSLMDIEQFPAELFHFAAANVGLSGVLPPFAKPCKLMSLYVPMNDLTHIDLTGCPVFNVDVSDNPELTYLGELHVNCEELAVSRTKLPQPDHLPELLSMFIAEDMVHWTKPINMPRGVSQFVVSGSPVGRIVMDNLPTFLERFEAENCLLTEFPFIAPIDNSWWALTFASRVKLAHNLIRHIAPGVLAPHLLSLDISHNLLEELDASAWSDAPRVFLDASHNRITNAGTSISAQVINLSHNQLTSLPHMPYVHSLDASHNQLTSAVMSLSQHVVSSDAFVNTFQERVGYGTLLDLSHNNITTMRDALMFESIEVARLNNNALVEMDLPAVVLRELDVSHNQLRGFEDVVMRLGPDATVLHAGHNALHRGDALRDLPASLHTLQLQHNDFSGPLPRLSHLPKIASLDLHHSGFGVDAHKCDDPTSHECVGPSLTVAEYRTADNEMMACPVFALTHNPDVIVDMDATEYATNAVCECIFGFYGAGAECKRCPENALCSGTYVMPEQGFWNHIYVDRDGAPADALIQRCVSYTTTTTCSPDNSLASFVKSLDEGTVRDMPRCAPGHTGRMCAACEVDHFQWGDRCNKCPNGAGVFFLLTASFIIVIAAVVYSYKVKPGTNASLKVLVFFTQTIQLARTTGVQMDSRVAGVLDFFSGFMVEMPGIECVWRGYGIREDTFAAMTMPLWACVLVLAVYAAGLFRASDKTMWWDRNVGALLLLNFMLYLRVASSVLSPLRCEEDPFLGHRYFAVAPSDVCDDTVITVSAVMVAVYVVLLPAVMASVLFRHRHSLSDDRTSTRFRFLYASYRRRYWYWEGVITLRKLAILTIMASSARSSVAVPLGVFLVLVLSAVLQDRIKPFAESRDNVMEYTSLWTLSVLFVLLTASSVPGVRMPLWTGAMVATAQIVFVSGVLVIMVRRHRATLQRLPSVLTNTLGRKFSMRGPNTEKAVQDALLGGDDSDEDDSDEEGTKGDTEA